MKLSNKILILCYYIIMKDAVIFDLDGTLLNTLDDLKESTNYALSQFNFPTITLEEVRNFVGNGVRKLIERAVPKNCNTETVEKCLSIFKEHYDKTDEIIQDIKYLTENTCLNMNDFNFMIGFVDNEDDEILHAMTQDEQVDFYKRMSKEFRGTSLDYGVKKE